MVCVLVQPFSLNSFLNAAVPSLSFPSQKENRVSISRPAETQPQLRGSYLQHDAVFDAFFCASGLAGSLRLLLRVAIAAVSTGRTIAERPSTQLQQLQQCHAAALLLVNVCTKVFHT